MVSRRNKFSHRWIPWALLNSIRFYRILLDSNRSNSCVRSLKRLLVDALLANFVEDYRWWPAITVNAIIEIGRTNWGIGPTNIARWRCIKFFCTKIFCMFLRCCTCSGLGFKLWSINKMTTIIRTSSWKSDYSVMCVYTIRFIWNSFSGSWISILLHWHRSVCSETFKRFREFQIRGVSPLYGVFCDRLSLVKSV